jgi:hypothetical protein
MREEVALFLLLLVIVSLVFLFYNMPRDTKEGFNNHQEFVLRQDKQFNDIGLSLSIKKNTGLLGKTANDLLNTFEFPKNTPLNDKRDGLWESIDKCEAVKTMDCDAFDDPEFSKICGICLDIGKNSDSVPATGGMVLLSTDRKLARENASSNYLPEYQPTVGFCPAGKMVSTKAECLKLQRQLLCRKNSSYSLEGCSQCYSDTTYSIVDPKTSPGVVAGSGHILIAGKGILKVEEQGFPARNGIKLSQTKPYKLNIKGKEGTRIKFILETAPVSDDEDADIPYISGLLNGDTGSGVFSSDLRRIVMVDEVTGRKPRSQGKDTIDNVAVTKMAPGFEKDRAIIVVIVPFTFVETTMEESSKCKDAPFVTTQAAAEFLESDPCYKKGSGPGKFSLECLQGIWDDNGCNGSGKGYPGNATSAATLMAAKDGSFLSLNAIADFIYNKALITSTGVDENGKLQPMKEWSEASVFCTGREITSPCDTPDKNKGPLSPACIIHLWNNQSSKKTWQGKDDPIGPTYSPSNAVSLFKEGTVPRSCQTTGTLSPVDPNGKNNRAVIRYWQRQGGVANVKRVMSDLHRAANAQMVADDRLAPYFQQCYGDVPFAPRPPTIFKIANNKLPETYRIKHNNTLLQSLTMTQDYKLQFVITPRAITHSNFSSIIHFTADDRDHSSFGSRTPAIWFWPGDLRLHVRIGANSDLNWGMDIPGCQLNKESMFSLECRGTSVRITLDGKVFSATHPNWRYSGNVKVYGGNPWYPSAVADIKDVGLQLFGNSIKADGRKNVIFNNININGGGASVNRHIGNFPDLNACINAGRQAQPDGNYAVTYGGGQCWSIGPTDPYDRHFNPHPGWTSAYFRSAGEVLPHISNIRFVRIEGGSVLNMSQLVVLDENGNNISRGRPSQVNSETYSDANRSKANDGGESWRPHPQEYHGRGADDLWQVQLDGPSNVSAVIVYNRSDCCQDRMASGFVIKLYAPDGAGGWKAVFVSDKLTGAHVQVIKTIENGTGWKTVHGNNGTVSCQLYCNGPRAIGGTPGPWGGELPREWNGAKCIRSSNPDVGCDRAPGLKGGFSCVCEKTGKGW